MKAVRRFPPIENLHGYQFRKSGLVDSNAEAMLFLRLQKITNILLHVNTHHVNTQHDYGDRKKLFLKVS